MKSFETKEKEAVVVDFELDGRSMRFTTPKRAGLIASVVNNVGLDGRSVDTDSTRDLLNWIGEGLSDDDGEYFLDRLKDPEDDFDLADVNEVAKYLLGQSSNRPTRRQRG